MTTTRSSSSIDRRRYVVLPKRRMPTTPSTMTSSKRRGRSRPIASLDGAQLGRLSSGRRLRGRLLSSFLPRALPGSNDALDHDRAERDREEHEVQLADELRRALTDGGALRPIVDRRGETLRRSRALSLFELPLRP